MRISDWSSDVCSSDLIASGWQAAMNFHVATNSPALQTLPLRRRVGHRRERTTLPLPLPDAARLPVRCWLQRDHPAHGAATASAGPVEYRLAGTDGQNLDRHKRIPGDRRSEEHTSELQSLMRNSYAVFCLKKKKTNNRKTV